MRADDIVVDTCVLCHASNPASGRQDESIALIEDLLRSITSLCIDPDFDLDESKNRSRIFSEYLNYLNESALGYYALIELASTQRLIPVSTKIDGQTAKKINQLVNDNTDRVFARVAYNSKEKTIVSHDFVAYSKGRRQELDKQLSISVYAAKDLV